MKQWLSRQDAIISRLLSRECDMRAVARCHECGQKAPQCVDCIVKDHQHLPFHWIDHWNGTFFERVGLAELGHIIHLGHGNAPCPNLPTNPSPAYFVIAHTNGVHRCRIQYCHCANRDEQVYQLITAALWPATLDRPESGFTFDVLKLWHLEWDISHMSAQDFYRILQHLTDNGSPLNIENRYRDLLSTSRMWRHFTMVKRSGRHHGIVLPHRDPQAITVPYIHRMILGCDGNHSLHKKTKKEDPNDVSLAVNQGYFVNHEHMSEYLKESYEDEETLETCSGFRVLRSLRPGKFRFLSLSGLIGTWCRHVLFRHGGTVDIQTGER
ncbi:hypothetical protein C2E23DRAFT_868595 [Lenzites betulinus]|nr:hypothetical protein C2E23DRAFT_868595 [Lenzites betulinus]